MKTETLEEIKRTINNLVDRAQIQNYNTMQLTKLSNSLAYKFCRSSKEFVNYKEASKQFLEQIKLYRKPSNSFLDKYYQGD